MLIKKEYIDQLLLTAELAKQKGLVPVSALLVTNNTIFYEHNGSSILDHAEIMAIKKGESNNKNLENSILIVSIEPCMMCLGAIMQAHIKKIYHLIESPKESFYTDFNSHLVHYSDFYKAHNPLLLPIENFESEKKIYKQLITNFFSDKR